MRPARTPIGLQLTQASRSVSRAFDDALAAAGGSLPVWLVLISLKSGDLASQRQLAEMVGVREATLTHHLAAMESSGLVSRRREASNRRVQVVELTPAGEAMFSRLRDVAVSFDKQLRRGITAAQVAELEELLGRLAANAGAGGPSPRA
jgi:MarR family transcriptional regulator, transcriptional regulator for hemolysin